MNALGRGTAAVAYVSMGGAACCGFYSLSANNVG